MILLYNLLPHANFVQLIDVSGKHATNIMIMNKTPGVNSMSRQVLLDLSGTWDFLLDTDNSYEKQSIFYNEHSLDWLTIGVPGHWQTSGYEGYQGTVWYRKHFTIAPQTMGSPQTKGRLFIRFSAVDYFAEVWLNGIYLGFHEGDFDAFSFDITDKVKPGEPNNLYVKVTSDIDANPEHKQVAKGGLYHWDCLPIRQEGLPNCPEVPSSANAQYPNPLINPGGIWQTVEVIYEAAGSLSSLQVTPLLDEGYQNADLFAECTYRHYGRADQLTLTMQVIPYNFEGQSFVKTQMFRVKPGNNQLSQHLFIEQPELWWPWDMGAPHLYAMRLTISDEQAIIDQAEIQFGFREIRKDDAWGMYLNGKRFFARGTNYLSGQFLSQISDETYQQDLTLIRTANMNMIRVFAHLERKRFYELCDQLGLLVFQDLPFQWGYADDGLFIARAKHIAEQSVQLLYSHPSIIIWSCHSESRLHDYNKLDNVLLDTVRELDPTRIVHKNSVLVDQAPLPHYLKDLNEFAQYVPAHLSVNWVGWYWGQVEDAEAYNPLFITEFGTQSLPNEESLKKFMPQQDLWPPNLAEWSRRGFQPNVYQKNLGELPPSLPELIDVSQNYQAYFYKSHIEAMRRKKYKNVNGLLQFHLVNTWPGIDWSIVDYYRQPKRAYFLIQQAFHPLLVSSKSESAVRTMTAQGKMGWQFEVSAWIVNDYYNRYEGSQLAIDVEDESGKFLLYTRIPLPPIAENVSELIHRFKVISDSSRIMVRTLWLSREGKILASNRNILIPPKDLTLIDDPVKSKIGV